MPNLCCVQLGVNQGGVASGLLFRKYMSDLKTYLSTAHGICMNNEIIAHLLWADDLILFSDTFKGLQIQLDGLKQFCSNNHMIVNEIKTKIMVFGNPKRSKIHFNSVDIDEVTDYKYLGNIISSTRLPYQDPLKKTYKFLSDQARKAIFSMSHKIKSIGELPIDIMFNLFDALIKPILIYDSDVWGLRSELWGTIDKVFFQYSRCMLHVKATTNNIITVGECGRFPPSTYCPISALCYLNRVHNMESNQLAKKIVCDLVELDQQGFNTWATDASKLVNDLRLDVTNDKNSFSMNCKRAIQNKFKTTWITKYRVVSTFKNIQNNQIRIYYGTLLVFSKKKARYRQAIAKFRCSSHTLGIERGRHTNPKTPVADRKCNCCDVIEDEKHFLLMCDMNMPEREYFFQKISRVYDGFTD